MARAVSVSLWLWYPLVRQWAKRGPFSHRRDARAYRDAHKLPRRFCVIQDDGMMPPVHDPRAPEGADLYRRVAV
jgi:hypothetical protein